MSTRSFSPFIPCAAILLAGGAVGCVTSDVDPPDDSGGMSNAGGSTSSGGSPDTGGMGGATSVGGTGGAPAPVVMFRCEDPNGPKVTAGEDDPLIVDFETGAFSLTSPSDFNFTGGAANGGTYTYQETGTQIMLNASLVEDRNVGQALSVLLTNSTDYGGGMGLYFYPCVDASGYAGFTFFARGNLPERTVAGAAVPAGTVTMSLDIGDVAVNSLDTIGCAMDMPVDATVCTRPMTTFVVSDTWTQFTFMWDDFNPGNKNGTPFNPTGDNFLGINLAMDNAFGTPNDLELVIDDVAFVP